MSIVQCAMAHRDDGRLDGGAGGRNVAERIMADGSDLGAVSGYQFEEIELGMQASVENTVTEAHIQSFAEVSGDYNPVHLDDAFASQTLFKERISHGMLTASYISAVFGMHLPGPGAIYVTQTLNFRRPVVIGDTIRTTVTVAEIFPPKRRVRFECRCQNADGKVVLEGEAMMMIPAREAG